jgi:hypothetical protein
MEKINLKRITETHTPEQAVVRQQTVTVAANQRQI